MAGNSDEAVRRSRLPGINIAPFCRVGHRRPGGFGTRYIVNGKMSTIEYIESTMSSHPSAGCYIKKLALPSI